MKWKPLLKAKNQLTVAFRFGVYLSLINTSRNYEAFVQNMIFWETPFIYVAFGLNSFNSSVKYTFGDNLTKVLLLVIFENL